MESDLERAQEKRKSEKGKAMALQTRLNTWLGVNTGFRDPARERR